MILHLLRRSFAQISSTRAVEKQNYNRSVLVIIYVVDEEFYIKQGQIGLERSAS